MKIFPLAFFLILAIAGWTSAQEAPTPGNFLAALRVALTEKDAAKLAALTYSVGMTQTDKALTTHMHEPLLGGQMIETITLKPLDEDLQPFFVEHGCKIEPTHPPSGLIEIKYKPAGNGALSSSAPSTIVDGRHYLVGTKLTHLDWKGPPDKTIGYMISGSGRDSLQITVNWNASGVDLEHTFKANSQSFEGQYIQKITVTNTSDDAEITLTVLEDGKAVYESAPLKGRGSLNYQRKD